MKKVLLLGASYEVLNFIGMKKAIKLFVKEKVEVISNWDDKITYGAGEIQYPSILRLKNPPKRHFYINNFNRKALIKRDNAHCQYCNKKLTGSEITIDHVIPKSQGGNTSFNNCVIACHSCNSIKADRTPEEADMRLLRKPTLPSFAARKKFVDNPDVWNKAWDDFLSF